MDRAVAVKRTGFRRLSSLAGALAAVYAAILVAAYQSQFLPFFQPLLIGAGRVWTGIYYGFWGSAVLLGLLLFAACPHIRRASLPAVVLCAYSLIMCALHPVDAVAKNFILAVALSGCLVIFVGKAGDGVVARFSATITALMAIICLFDVLFADGLTNTAGRAAGFSVNANDAAASLVLGAVATYRSLPAWLRLPFLLLVAAAVGVTLSRSTILVGLVVIGLFIIASLVWNGRRHRIRPLQRRTFALNGMLFVALVGWIGLAATTNSYFIMAADDSFHGLSDAYYAFSKVETRFQLASGNENRTEVAPVPAGNDIATTSAATEEGIAGSQASETLALAQAAVQEGEENSAASRALLLKQSVLAFLSGPILGSGLQAAHDLVPHNSFMLFALAFGWPGLLIPLGYLALTFRNVSKPGDLVFGATAAGLMCFSHDILLVPGLLVPLIVGIADRTRPEGGEPAARSEFLAVRMVAALTCLFLFLGGAVMASAYTGEQWIALRASDILQSGKDPHVFYSPFYPPLFQGLLRTVDTRANSVTTQPVSILEDDRPIAPSQSRLQDWAVISNGEFFQYRRNEIVFTATDNSDPRTNGRTYSAEEPVEVHPLMYLVLIAALGWCIGVFLLFRARPPR